MRRSGLLVWQILKDLGEMVKEGVTTQELEAAAERRRELDRGRDALVTQIHALGTDRPRLASELDHATARSRGLETATREVARRVDQAIETIRGVLADDK